MLFYKYIYIYLKYNQSYFCLNIIIIITTISVWILLL